MGMHTLCGTVWERKEMSIVHLWVILRVCATMDNKVAGGRVWKWRFLHISIHRTPATKLEKLEVWLGLNIYSIWWCHRHAGRGVCIGCAASRTPYVDPLISSLTLGRPLWLSDRLITCVPALLLMCLAWDVTQAHILLPSTCLCHIVAIIVAWHSWGIYSQLGLPPLTILCSCVCVLVC